MPIQIETLLKKANSYIKGELIASSKEVAKFLEELECRYSEYRKNFPSHIAWEDSIQRLRGRTNFLTIAEEKIRIARENMMRIRDAAQVKEKILGGFTVVMQYTPVPRDRLPEYISELRKCEEGYKALGREDLAANYSRAIEDFQKRLLDRGATR